MAIQELFTDLRTVTDPAHTAVLVIDVQNDFCASGGHTEVNLGKDVSDCQAVVGPINRLTATARRAGIPVIWVKADYDRAYLSRPIRAKQAARGIKTAYCVSGSWGAAFYEVAPQDGDIVIEKHRHSAFVGTELEQILRDRGIQTLVVTGVQTHVCVESSLRDGSARGYYIVVPKECVGSFDRALHEATLRCIDLHFGEVATTQDLLDRWAPNG
jgi:ureidoacrylate peracid hydrolase